jgi:hypothetical protein
VKLVPEQADQGAEIVGGDRDAGHSGDHGFSPADPGEVSPVRGGLLFWHHQLTAWSG